MSNLPEAKMGVSNMPVSKVRDNVYGQFDANITKNRYSTTSSNYYIRELDAFFGRKSDSVSIDTNVVGDVTLHVELDTSKIEGLDCYLPEAWGLRMVESIEYRAANSAPMRIDGDALLLYVMQNCQTIEKRQQILRACGQERVVANDPNEPDRLVADVPLWSPFSNSLHYTNPDKIGLDLRLLNKPGLSCTVNFRPLVDVMSGNDVNQVSQNLIDESYLRFTQRRFNDQNDSIANDITASTAPALYWFIQPNQNFVRLREVGVPFSRDNPTSKMRYRLDGFISESELINMSIMVRRSKPDDRRAYNPHVLSPISNLVISYLGQPLWQVDNNVLFCNQSELSACGFNAPDPDAPGGQITAPFMTQLKASDYLDVHFTEEAQQKFQGLLQKGTTVTELDIDFNTIDNSLYDVIVIYRYNHALSIDNRGNCDVLAVMR